MRWPISDTTSISAQELNTLVITLPLSACDPSSTQPWVIARPWDKLADKYFTPGNFLSAEFDVYAARRAGTDPDWQNRLEGADLMATGLMNSRVSSADIDAVLANRSRIEAALRAIPADLPLADAELTQQPLRGRLQELIGGFRVPGFGVAKIMKTLCQKRPRLLPMLDREVRRSLDNCVVADPPVLSDDPDTFADEVLAEIGLFRKVLLWNAGNSTANYPRLQQLADALSNRLADGYGRWPELVTAVRILDDLLWFEWHGYRHYGWAENEFARCVEKPS